MCLHTGANERLLGLTWRPRSFEVHSRWHTLKEFTISCRLRMSAVTWMNLVDIRSHWCALELDTRMKMLICFPKLSRSPKPFPPCRDCPSCFPDGLVDCMDPDCCTQIACQGQTYCRGSPDPTAIAGQGQSSAAQPASKSFYDRVSFLIGPNGCHMVPWDNAFNSR